MLRMREFHFDILFGRYSNEVPGGSFESGAGTDSAVQVDLHMPVDFLCNPQLK